MPNTPSEFLHFDDWRAFFASSLPAKSWQTVYRSLNTEDENGLIYCALLPSGIIKEKLEDHSWDLRTSDGFPGLSQSRTTDQVITSYDRLGFLGGIEPLVICRTFYTGPDGFHEISEEFRLFHNLYQGKKREEYFKDDDAGNPEIVARILPDKVEIRTKEIRQFLAIKDMHLAIQVDISRYGRIGLADYSGTDKDELSQTEDASFNWGIRECNWLEPYATHAFLMGKKLLAPCPKNESGKWPYNERKENYPTFIIGRDENGKDVEFTCEESRLKNNFGANPDAPHYLTPVHFRGDVLSKYYSHSDRFSVGDGHLRAGSKWSLKMDNDHTDRVVVFLGDLGRDLPPSERDYWRSFNIPPEGPPISKTAYTRSIRGWFANPSRPDLAFKNLYPHFRQKWRDRFGWDLFLPLSDDDQHHFTALRIPINNDQGEFDAQVQSLTKLIIDSLNEPELEKGLTLPPETKGIGKFEAFLQANKIKDVASIISFLRNLQTLRSTGVAHRKGSNYQKIAKVFDLENKDFKDVAAELFTSTLQMMRTLGTELLPEHDWKE